MPYGSLLQYNLDTFNTTEEVLELLSMSVVEANNVVRDRLDIPKPWNWVVKCHLASRCSTSQKAFIDTLAVYLLHDTDPDVYLTLDDIRAQCPVKLPSWIEPEDIVIEVGYTADIETVILTNYLLLRDTFYGIYYGVNTGTLSYIREPMQYGLNWYKHGTSLISFDVITIPRVCYRGKVYEV